MADFTGFVVDAPDLPFGIDHPTGFLCNFDASPFGIDHPTGDPIFSTTLWFAERNGVAQITLGAATLSSDGTVITPATTGQLAVTLGALIVASAGTAGDFQPSRERITHVPSWPRILLAENPDRVIELYRLPRTVRIAA